MPEDRDDDWERMIVKPHDALMASEQASVEKYSGIVVSHTQLMEQLFGPYGEDDTGGWFLDQGKWSEKTIYQEIDRLIRSKPAEVFVWGHTPPARKRSPTNYRRKAFAIAQLEFIPEKEKRVPRLSASSVIDGPVSAAHAFIELDPLGGIGYRKQVTTRIPVYDTEDVFACWYEKRVDLENKNIIAELKLRKPKRQKILAERVAMALARNAIDYGETKQEPFPHWFREVHFLHELPENSFDRIPLMLDDQVYELLFPGYGLDKDHEDLNEEEAIAMAAVMYKKLLEMAQK